MQHTRKVLAEKARSAPPGKLVSVHPQDLLALIEDSEQLDTLRAIRATVRPIVQQLSREPRIHPARCAHLEDGVMTPYMRVHAMSLPGPRHALTLDDTTELCGPCAGRVTSILLQVARTDAARLIDPQHATALEHLRDLIGKLRGR